MRRQIVIGNWKLHGSRQFVTQLLQQLVSGWVGVHRAEVVVCPVSAHMEMAYRALGHSNIALGAQDVSHFAEGPYTGDVSGEMLHELGCHYAIVGHSERRRHYGESNELVAKKFMAAQDARLVPILCVGESAREREQGVTLEVIDRQIGAVLDVCGIDRLARAVIAYEPLWAVGTGKIASPLQAQEVHQFIRCKLGASGAMTRIVYGGSVTPLNAESMFAMPDIDGALVGGAALRAHDFLAICRAAD
jgi:triosephosphate isomerase